jgi:hypothetical protein
MSVGHWWNDADLRKLKCFEKKKCITNYSWIGLVSNVSCLSENGMLPYISTKSVSNFLLDDMVSFQNMRIFTQCGDFSKVEAP